MHPAIKGVPGKPVKWHKLFQSLTTPPFNDLRISDIREISIQLSSRDQPSLHD